MRCSLRARESAFAFDGQIKNAANNQQQKGKEFNYLFSAFSSPSQQRSVPVSCQLQQPTPAARETGSEQLQNRLRWGKRKKEEINSNKLIHKNFRKRRNAPRNANRSQMPLLLEAPRRIPLVAENECTRVIAEYNSVFRVKLLNIIPIIP